MLIVDAANVVGSRPDRWWRDRPAAARRLNDQLLAADLDHVVLVVEGHARQGISPTDFGAGTVRVVHAAGSGDDAIVDLVRRGGPGLTVVTADRELRRRVAELGAEVAGPRYVLDRLGS